MSLKDLIATPGEIAAARITRDFDFSSHDAHERLFTAIKEAVDGFPPAPGKTELAAALRAVVMAYEAGVADGASRGNAPERRGE